MRYSYKNSNLCVYTLPGTRSEPQRLLYAPLLLPGTKKRTTETIVCTSTLPRYNEWNTETILCASTLPWYNKWNTETILCASTSPRYNEWNTALGWKGRALSTFAILSHLVASVKLSEDISSLSIIPLWCWCEWVQHFAWWRAWYAILSFQSQRPLQPCSLVPSAD